MRAALSSRRLGRTTGDFVRVAPVASALVTAPLAATAAEEGKKVIIAMLIVGLIFVGVIAVGQLTHWVSHRRGAARR